MARSVEVKEIQRVVFTNTNSPVFCLRMVSRQYIVTEWNIRSWYWQNNLQVGEDYEFTMRLYCLLQVGIEHDINLDIARS